MQTYCFDIDGTICSNTYGEYDKAIPILPRIAVINRLYDDGNIIYFMTARGMSKAGNNAVLAYSYMYTYTEQQLRSWKVKYHALFLGKPKADFYVDDKGIEDTIFFIQQKNEH